MQTVIAKSSPSSHGDRGREVDEGGNLPDEVAVKRSDPVYNAHAYLTKIPITAIEIFLDAFTSPGDIVLDMYGGSGMTGVAAIASGRRAEVRDISVLGRHIGTNYLNLVDPGGLRRTAIEVVAAVEDRIGDAYAVPCRICGDGATLSRTVWSYVYECSACSSPVNYYEAFRSADWRKTAMECGSCGAPFVTRGSPRLEEVPAFDTVNCVCSKRLRDQEHFVPPDPVMAEGVLWRGVEIPADRQMYQASALGRHGLATTRSFFSERNFAVLSTLREAIAGVEDEALGEKLLFAFTAILTRASKRYQWHPKRPLNAANQNYYIAPVFFEWNVLDLFTRKVEASIRSDRHIRERMTENGVNEIPEFRYEIGSADRLNIDDESIDYVFTDPPFGSNIFYSDMNLFQEAWLDAFTDHKSEAVVDRSNGAGARSAERYEHLITGSLCEAHRVLRPGGWLSIVFSNSQGEMWALLQRAISQAGFRLGEVTLLNKGQRSVKGLSSGFESVVTADLVLSLQKTDGHGVQRLIPPQEPLGELITSALDCGAATTPSHLFLRLVRRFLQRNWDLAELHIRDVITLLESAGYGVDPASGAIASLDELRNETVARRRV